MLLPAHAVGGAGAGVGRVGAGVGLGVGLRVDGVGVGAGGMGVGEGAVAPPSHHREFPQDSQRAFDCAHQLVAQALLVQLLQKSFASGAHQQQNGVDDC